MPITLSPETEARLLIKAEHLGDSVNHVADKMISEALDWEAQDRLEAVEGIRRGLEAFEQGRSRPFSEFAAEQRAKYHLTNDG